MTDLEDRSLTYVRDDKILNGLLVEMDSRPGFAAADRMTAKKDDEVWDRGWVPRLGFMHARRAGFPIKAFGNDNLLNPPVSPFS